MKKKPQALFEKAEIIDAPWKLNKNIPLSPELGSEWAQQSVRASEARSAEQANKWAVQANERADEVHYIWKLVHNISNNGMDAMSMALLSRWRATPSKHPNLHMTRLPSVMTRGSDDILGDL